MPIALLYTINSIHNGYQILEKIPKENQLHWKVKCTHCGKITTKRGTYLRSNKPCKCQRRQSKEADFKQVWNRYTFNAKNRSLEFNLSYEQFKELILQNCYYCGREPHMTLKYRSKLKPLIFNGIDRKINSIGYNLENCVPCCKICNESKRTMDHDEFLKWVKRIYEYRATR